MQTFELTNAFELTLATLTHLNKSLQKYINKLLRKLLTNKCIGTNTVAVVLLQLLIVPSYFIGYFPKTNFENKNKLRQKLITLSATLINFKCIKCYMVLWLVRMKLPKH